MKKSEIAVLIPHYNNYLGLVKSLQSIDENITVDVFIIDDGSERKPLEEEINTIYTNGLVKIYFLEKNQGIEIALNKGLEFILTYNYEYIGRLDCGDLCIKDKFKIQLEYLKLHPNIALLGSWVNVVDEQLNLLYILKHPTTYKEIKKQMYINSMFVHPTVVFRSKIINEIGMYPINFKAAEDYAFFFNIIKMFQAENLPEILVNYVVDSKSISSKNRQLQVKSRIRVIIKNFYFGYHPFYGLIRNCLLLFVSRKVTTVLKKAIKR